MYAVCFQSSFARYMSAQGFDTWTLEVRGAGLSTYGHSLEKDEECLTDSSEIDSAINDSKSSSFERALEFKNLGASFESEDIKYEESRPTERLMEVLTGMSERLLSFLGSC